MSAQSFKAIGVGQRQWGITDSLSIAPVIGTTRLGPCAALIIDDRARQVSCIGHIDALTNLASIKALFDEMLKGSMKGNLKVTLIGGWEKVDLALYRDPNMVPSFIIDTYNLLSNTTQFCKKRRANEVMEKVLKEEKLTLGEREIIEKSFYTLVQVDSRTGEITVEDPANPILSEQRILHFRERCEGIPDLSELTNEGVPLVKVWDMRKSS